MKKFKQTIFEPSFEPKDHLYKDDNGNMLDSVTQILKMELNTFNFKFPGNAASKGTHIHTACEYYDEGDLDVNSLSPEIVPYVAGYIVALELEEIEILQNEVRRYHPKYLYAGTIDKIWKVKGIQDVTDIKSGLEYPQYKWQISAYEEMVRHEIGKSTRHCLYLLGGKKIRRETFGWTMEDYIDHFRKYPREAYKFVKHDGKRDFLEFLALLSAFQIKKNNGYIKEKRR